MDELDELWAQMMQQAIARAQNAGQRDIAEYLSLKAGNDALRAAGCRWLFDSFIELSDEVNRQGIRLEVENFNPHRFTAGHATMVGSLLKFHYGLRNLSIEAGWTRTPQDGFMRGGGLARARISHFGISKANAELLLARSAGNVPQWQNILENGNRLPVFSNHLREHFNIFLGQI